MKPAFETIYSLLNALLGWVEEDTFLESTLWDIWDATQDIENVFYEKEERIKELEKKVESRYKEKDVFRFTEFSEYNAPDRFDEFIEELKECNSLEEVRKVIASANMANGNRAGADIADILSRFIDFEPTNLGELSGLEDMRKQMHFDDIVQGVKERYDNYNHIETACDYLHQECKNSSMNPDRVISHLLNKWKLPAVDANKMRKYIYNLQ